MAASALTPLVSFLVGRSARREAEADLDATLQGVQRCGLPPDQIETVLIDRSPTPAFIERFPVIQLMDRHQRPLAATLPEAMSRIRGRYVVWLSPGSVIRPGAVVRMMVRFDAEPTLGALCFYATRPDGTPAHGELGGVIDVRCCGIRRRALDEIRLPQRLESPLDAIDLSSRMLARGWEIRAVDDLHVSIPVADQSPHFERLVREDLKIVSQWLPRRWIVPIGRDWVRRRRMEADDAGRLDSHYRGLAVGLMRALVPRERIPLDEPVMEAIFRPQETENRLRRLKHDLALKRILLLDLTPNSAFLRAAARKLALEIAAIADNRFARPHRRFARLRVLRDEQARAERFDAAIAAHLHPLAAESRLREWRALGDPRPSIDLFAASAAAVSVWVRESAAVRRTAVRSA